MFQTPTSAGTPSSLPPPAPLPQAINAIEPSPEETSSSITRSVSPQPVNEEQDWQPQRFQPYENTPSGIPIPKKFFGNTKAVKEALEKKIFDGKPTFGKSVPAKEKLLGQELGTTKEREAFIKYYNGRIKGQTDAPKKPGASEWANCSPWFAKGSTSTITDHFTNPDIEKLERRVEGFRYVNERTHKNLNKNATTIFVLKRRKCWKDVGNVGEIC